MARLPALEKIISPRDYRGAAHAENLVRVCREGGLAQVSKRGRGAAQQGPAEAARLALAFATGEPPACVVEATRAFASAEARGGNGLAIGINPVFDAIASARTLGDALTACIVGTPDLVRQACLEAVEQDPERDLDRAAWLAVRGMVLDFRVSLFRPRCTARIALVRTLDGRPVELACAWFDAQSIYPVCEGGVAIRFTGEFGLELMAPLAFAVRNAEENSPAAGLSSVRGEQRRETVRAAPSLGDDDGA